jgi:site-specific DNA-cytosine methylase
MTIRALEFFCGIGGFAAAVTGHDVRIVGAFDQDPLALETYRHNFSDHPCRQLDLERVNPQQLGLYKADLWWLSPPCQPYSVRGRQKDLDDPRARSLVRIMDILEELPAPLLPKFIALENVIGFVSSQARQRLLQVIAERGYRIREEELCPTALGIPSRRPRYYLTASRKGFADAPSLPTVQGRLSDYLETIPDEDIPIGLQLSGDQLERFGNGLRILDPTDPAVYTTCFAASYGKTLVNSGAYLRHGDSVRRFTPLEIARLLGFPIGFSFPTTLTMRQKWHLIGNSLSIFAVQKVLRAFPCFSLPPFTEG